MSDSPLVFFLFAGVCLLLGVSALRSKEVYLGRLIRFVGPKLVLRTRIAVLIHGALITAAGVMALVVAIAKVFDSETALVDQIMPPAFLVFGVGFFGSMIVELFFYASGMGPYDYGGPEDFGDKQRNSYR